MPLSGRLQAPKRELLRWKSFSHGMNAAASPADIPAGQAVLLQNWALSEDGSILLRRGTQQWNTSSLGSATVSARYRAFLNSTAFWLTVLSGTLYQSSGSAASGNTFTSAAVPAGATLTSAKPTWFTQYLSYAYLSTTVDVPIKSTNGTAWTVMGVAAPTAAPSGTATTGGSMTTGSYTFELAYQSITVEGQPSAASSTVTLTGSQNAVALTFPASSVNTAITGINVYGSETGVSNTYQQIATGLSASSTGYTVTAAQASWSNTAPATGHATPPVGPYLMRAWKSRMWKSGDPNNPQRVYFSDLFIPESWPAANFFDVPFEAGDKVNAIFPLGDILFIFGTFSIYYVLGDTPFSFVVKQSFAQGGAPGPNCIDRIQNTLVFLSNFSTKVFDGSTERILSGNIDPYFTGIFSSTSALNQAAASGASLTYYDQLNAIVVSMPTGSSTTNNTTFWYFLKTEGWVLDNRSVALFGIDNAPNGSGNLFAFDATAGIMRQWDVQNSYVDDELAITTLITTGLLIPGDNPRRWYYFRIFAQPSNNTASITALVDGGAQSDTMSLNFASQGGGIYGTSTYGTATYASSLVSFDERWIDSMVGQTLQLQISMVAKNFFRLVYIAQEAVALPKIRWYTSTTQASTGGGNTLATTTIYASAGSAGGDYTTTGAGYTAIDVTNLTISVKIPSGQKVSVMAKGSWQINSPQHAQIALFDGTTELDRASYDSPVLSVDDDWSLEAVVQGDGATHTLQLQYLVQGGATLTVRNSNNANAPKLVARLEPSN